MIRGYSSTVGFVILDLHQVLHGKKSFGATERAQHTHGSIHGDDN